MTHPKVPVKSKTSDDIEVHIKPGFCVKDIETPVRVSLPFYVDGVALPTPALDDDLTALWGALHRYGRATPVVDELIFKEFDDFTALMFPLLFIPLPADSDCSVGTWLDGTSYTVKRKEELLIKYERNPVFNPLKTKIKSFIKDESYPEFKHARKISSRDDIYKVHFGPYVKLMEKEVYKLPYFVKHVPVNERAEYIMDFLDASGTLLAESDYTSFEALLVPRIQQIVEIRAYKYLLGNLLSAKDLKAMLDVLVGLQDVNLKNSKLTGFGRRASGEMCTSLGNGLSNLMFMLFVHFKAGGNITNFKGVFEGDDGLYRMISGLTYDLSLFEKLGLIIKLDVKPKLEDVSFCGLVFDPMEKILIRDPLKALVSLGWTTRDHIMSKPAYLMALQRAKAMSFLYQYSGCPILHTAVVQILKHTQHIDMSQYRERVLRNENEYVRKIMQEAFDADLGLLASREIGPSTRYLVQEKFGVSIDVQLRIEARLEALDGPGPIKLELADFSPLWVDFYHEHQLLPYTKYGSRQVLFAKPRTLNLLRLGRAFRDIINDFLLFKMRRWKPNSVC